MPHTLTKRPQFVLHICNVSGVGIKVWKKSFQKTSPIFQELQYQLLFTRSIGDFLKGNRQALSFHVVCLGLHLGGAGLFHSSSHTLRGAISVTDDTKTLNGCLFLVKEHTTLPNNLYLYNTVHQFINLLRYKIIKPDQSNFILTFMIFHHDFSFAAGRGSSICQDTLTDLTFSRFVRILRISRLVRLVKRLSSASLKSKQLNGM